MQTLGVLYLQFALLLACVLGCSRVDGGTPLADHLQQGMTLREVAGKVNVTHFMKIAETSLHTTAIMRCKECPTAAISMFFRAQSSGLVLVSWQSESENYDNIDPVADDWAVLLDRKYE